MHERVVCQICTNSALIQITEGLPYYTTTSTPSLSCVSGPSAVTAGCWGRFISNCTGEHNAKPSHPTCGVPRSSWPQRSVAAQPHNRTHPRTRHTPTRVSWRHRRARDGRGSTVWQRHARYTEIIQVFCTFFVYFSQEKKLPAKYCAQLPSPCVLLRVILQQPDYF